jgi:multiple sugar transport system permease protein
MSTTTRLGKIVRSTTLDERTIRKAGIYVALYGTAFLFVLPYLWMISASFQTRSEILDATPNFIPPEITFRWYRVLFSESQIIQWTVNTILIAAATTVVVLVIDSMIAFALTQLEWPGKRVVFAVIVASFMVPGIVNLIPVYTIVVKLGLINTYLGVILPSAAGALGVFMLVQFFRDFPEDIIEAARLDGFSTLRIYAQIVLPMMKPALTALGLFIFIWTWNSFVWPLLILQDSAAYTLPIGLVTLRDNMAISQPGIVMTSTVVASIPLFIVFLLLQKQLVRAVEMQGTVK